MRTGRPPKSPEQLRKANVAIPLTVEEKELVKSAADLVDAKHVTWSREVLLQAARKIVNKYKKDGR